MRTALAVASPVIYNVTGVAQVVGAAAAAAAARAAMVTKAKKGGYVHLRCKSSPLDSHRSRHLAAQRWQRRAIASESSESLKVNDARVLGGGDDGGIGGGGGGIGGGEGDHAWLRA